MRRSGFTLIELLIVVIIIGILAAIAVPGVGRTKERNRRVELLKSDPAFADSVKRLDSLQLEVEKLRFWINDGMARKLER